MKILQICSASSIGGGERHLADLSSGLVERGHYVFAAVRPGSPVRQILTAVDRDSAIEVEMRNAADAISASRIAGFGTRVGAEIIHAHLARDYPMAALASRLSDIPFVLTRHVLFPMKRLQKYVLRRVSAVIAPSSAVYDRLINEAVLPPDKVVLIHNGVDIDRFKPKPDKGTMPFTVGTVGHLGKIKGHDNFIRAAAAVGQERPDIRFVILGGQGSGSHERRELEILITRLEMDDRIEIRGWTDDICVPLGELDLFVSAARSEPFGLAIAEAMASGIPVIATNSEGAREIIVDGVSGVLVPTDEPDAIAASILRLAGDPSLRGRLSDEGRERVVDHFSLDAMVDKVETLYESVAGKSQQIATR
jgi:glycosyltransferase involved in cell wall biosynthesis